MLSGPLLSLWLGLNAVEFAPTQKLGPLFQVVLFKEKDANVADYDLYRDPLRREHILFKLESIKATG